jgi:two-component system response regulator
MPFPKTLIAEDDANDALSFQCAFKSAGVNATVHFVSDGVEVLDYLRGKQLFEKVASSTLPGLLLLNLDMPRLSGFGVLEWLRRHPHLRPPRVIVFGSADEPRAMERAMALGADQCVAKPSEPSALAAFIAAVREAFLTRILPGSSRNSSAHELAYAPGPAVSAELPGDGVGLQSFANPAE